MENKPIKVASFFAGIGGFDLGFEKAGAKVVWQCEVNPYCLDVLKAHWPNVPRSKDIKTTKVSDIPFADVCKADSSTILHDLLEKVAPKLSSSKTLRESSLPTRDEISQQSFGRWPTSGMAWRGECLTVDTSASPSHAQGSSFADLMETQKPPQEYFLSQNAAIGILRRVDRMGRHLLPPLRKSLEILSGATPRN